MDTVKGASAGLEAGQRLRSQNSACEVIVVKGIKGGSGLMCAGAQMLEASTAPVPAAVSGGPAVQLGKRYVDEESGLEVLCVRAGAGPLSFAGRDLAIKAAKPLPASD
jgi:hypothetical protein